MQKDYFLLLFFIVCWSCQKPEEPPKDPETYDKGVVINGVKWATRNVDKEGAFALSPESKGGLFQWNRKKAWNTIDYEIGDWDNSDATGDVWEKENDPSPAGWRVPTVTEFGTLFDLDKVIFEYVSRNGVEGVKFTDIVTGNNLFMPFVSLRNSDSFLELYRRGVSYWSNMVYDDASNKNSAYHLYINLFEPLRGGNSLFNFVPRLDYSYKNYGLSVRSVAQEGAGGNTQGDADDATYEAILYPPSMKASIKVIPENISSLDSVFFVVHTPPSDFNLMSFHIDSIIAEKIYISGEYARCLCIQATNYTVNIGVFPAGTYEIIYTAIDFNFYSYLYSTLKYRGNFYPNDIYRIKFDVSPSIIQK